MPGAQHRALVELRLLDLDDHVGGGEHFGGSGDDGCARRDIIAVGDARRNFDDNLLILPNAVRADIWEFIAGFKTGSLVSKIYFACPPARAKTATGNGDILSGRARGRIKTNDIRSVGRLIGFGKFQIIAGLAKNRIEHKSCNFTANNIRHVGGAVAGIKIRISSGNKFAVIAELGLTAGKINSMIADTIP